jgi:hypothetical protein
MYLAYFIDTSIFFTPPSSCSYRSPIHRRIIISPDGTSVLRKYGLNSPSILQKYRSSTVVNGRSLLIIHTRRTYLTDIAIALTIGAADICIARTDYFGFFIVWSSLAISNCLYSVLR